MEIWKNKYTKIQNKNLQTHCIASYDLRSRSSNEQD